MRAILAIVFTLAVTAQAQQLSVGGSYPTRATLIPEGNTCGSVTVQDNVTTVAHTAGQHTLSLTHAARTYDGTIDDDGVFVTAPKMLNVGGDTYTITIEGRFDATGFTATVTLEVRQQAPPPTCRYAVRWVGTKQSGTNTIPGSTREGNTLLVRHFGDTEIEPIGLAIDRKGTLFVAATDFAVRKVTAAGIVSVFAGAPDSAGFRDGSAADARFAGLHGIEIDSHGNLFVTDNPNHAVRRIAPDGTVTTFVGNGAPGSADGTGTAARLNFPHDLAIDAHDNLYVADVANHIIRKITPDGVMTTFAGQAGQRGGIDGRGSAARFEFPSSMDVDAAGNVWVGGNGTIRRIAPDGTVTTIAGVNGVDGSTDGQGTAARFQGPEGLAFAPNGDLYISSGSTLRKMDPQFRVTTVAGVAGLTGDVEGRGSAARLQFPLGIVVNAESRVFFADIRNHRVFAAVPDNLTCTASSSRVCLGSSRFSVTLSREGDAVSQQVNPIFGYFAGTNGPDVFVKAIDENGFSFVYGGLTDGEYTLTILDTTTGIAAPLVHAQGTTCGFETATVAVPSGTPPPATAGRKRAVRHPSKCPIDTVCLLGDRLRVTLHAGGGDGLALPGGTDVFGAFSVPALSGDASEPEVFLKAVDERASNGTVSLLHGALTASGYTITVTDTRTKESTQFTHAAGSRCGDFTTFSF